ncbi:MAG: hypothetical protein ACJAZ8_002158 [Planctomycetota bacterium]|jgi:hypothetical protein
MDLVTKLGVRGFDGRSLRDARASPGLPKDKGNGQASLEVRIQIDDPPFDVMGG